MKLDIKRKWIEALRSGEYVQGGGALRDSDNRFCCLGVLCDLAFKEEIVSFWRDDRGANYGRPDEPANRSTGFLPPSVQEWAGLDNDGTVLWNGEPWNLSSLNDNDHTFAEIADLIEEQL